MVETYVETSWQAMKSKEIFSDIDHRQLGPLYLQPQAFPVKKNKTDPLLPSHLQTESYFQSAIKKRLKVYLFNSLRLLFTIQDWA